MGRPSLARSRAPWLLLPLLLAALGLPMGCASARQRLPSLEAMEAQLAWPSLPRPAWERWPLLSRLRPPPPGAIQGRLARPDRKPLGRMVVYLDPLDPDREAEAPGEAAVIRQRGQRFVPSFLVVTAGQTVVFANEDSIYHRVFSYADPGSFDLGILEQGGSRAVTLEQPGLVRFYCTLHADETGLILVTPSTHFATVDRTGGYRISGVPPGRYRLHAWSEARADVTREVTVEPGVDASLDITVRGR
jgi:plastocyanin